MWRPNDEKPSENSDTNDVWWTSPTRNGEQLEQLFNEYLETDKSTEAEDKSFRARFTKLMPQQHNHLPTPTGLSLDIDHCAKDMRTGVDSPNTQVEVPRSGAQTVNNSRTSSPIIKVDPPHKQANPQATEHPLLSINQNYNINKVQPSKHSLSAVQHYRQFDERQSRRAPLQRRRTNLRSSTSEDRTDMLATTHSYDLASNNDLMGYQSQSMSYGTEKSSVSGPRTQMPISPPMSNAQLNLLAPNSVRNQSLNQYNLSSESLPSYNNHMNTLSRTHSMPQLQEQQDVNYDGRYMQHQSSSEYLSQSDSFDEDLLRPHNMSSYHGFAAPYSISEGLEIDTTGSAASSAQGSSPQPWWDQSANLDMETPSVQYPTGPFHTLPTMSPKRPRFPGMANDAIAENRLYTNIMDRSESTQSSIPSPPVSPAYYFSSAMSQEGYFAGRDGGVQFVDPFQQQSHEVSSSLLRSPAISTSYDMLPKSPSCKAVNMPGMLHSSSLTPSTRHLSVSRPTITRKGTASSLASSRVPSLSSASRVSSICSSKTDSKEVSFVNFTPHDANKILSGVAPSGSSKTKARREREALERRRKLSEAAAAAVLAAGGDPSNFPLDF